jgi:sugar phosphate isomerase/epimerase
MSVPAVGLQCIVFGKKYSIEDKTVLDRVAACGYKSVECGCKDPVAFKKMLDDRGMWYAGMHLVPRGLADLSAVTKTLHALESYDVCNSGLLEWEKQSAADFRETIKVLNKAGKQLRTEGIRLHYHNHDFEFKKVEGNKTGMDLLIEGLDPDCADFCFDVAWITKGGCDPIDMLLKHKDKAGYLHLKDYDDVSWTELGTGKVDIAGVVKILPKLTSVRHVMVEQDSARIDPLESIAISRKYLKEKCGY